MDVERDQMYHPTVGLLVEPHHPRAPTRACRA
jgi:hypothetical protein